MPQVARERDAVARKRAEHDAVAAFRMVRKNRSPIVAEKNRAAPLVGEGEIVEAGLQLADSALKRRKHARGFAGGDIDVLHAAVFRRCDQSRAPHDRIVKADASPGGGEM